MPEVATRVGLVGVGTMGSRMAERILEAGFELVVRDVRLQAAAVAVGLGAEAARSPAAVARAAEVVLLSLPGPGDTREVVVGADGLLSAAEDGLVIVDLSTVDPGTTRKFAAASAAVGVAYLDAPVLGRPQTCGRWTLPVGGDAGALETARPVLEALAQRVVHVGPPGHGNVVKLLNNVMFGAINAVTAEILSVCAGVGMSPRVLFETIAGSGAASVSNLFLELGPKILSRDFSPLFTLDLLAKDNALALRMAEETGAPMILARSTQLLNELARARGLGSEDTSALVKLYETLYGVEVRG